MNYLITVFTSIVISALSVVGVFNYYPLPAIQPLTITGDSLGAITTILGTDRLTDSRTTINDNFTDLDTTKMEMSTTSVAGITTLGGLTSATALASIGTVTTGTWNASTLTVAYGGTGSTTLTAFNILLGSTTNAIGTVEGLGASGQFLTSNGVGASPDWTTAAVSESDNYNWTGTHSWSNTATFNSTVDIEADAAANVTFNTVGLEFPSSQGASSTVLTNDGSGVLVWAEPSKGTYLFHSTTTDRTISNSSTETTLFGIDIPAGTLSVNDALRLHINVSAFGQTGGGADALTLRFKYGATTMCSLSFDHERSGQTAYIDAMMIVGDTTTSQEASLSLAVDHTSVDSAGEAYEIDTICSASEDITTELKLLVTGQFSAASAGNAITAINGTLEILDQ